jgi:coenzyme F420 hydrogenase subunit beta
MKESGATAFLRERVIDAGLCTHCGACVNLCPYYASHQDRIVVLDECDLTEGGCQDVCPRLPTDEAALKGALFDEADLTPEAGAVKAFYITRAADERVRGGAQHGGTVTALIQLALRESLIETAVLAGEGEPLLPSGVGVTRADQSARLSKSRFVASPNVTLFNELARGKTESIGIVATPCQSLALAKMRSSRSPRVHESVKKLRLVIGLFCGWAFSSSLLKELLASRVDLDSITGMDIPPSQYHSLEVFTTDGKISISLDEVQKCVRTCCHSCSDMTAEFSDVSVGSARLPEGWEVARSWNQLIVRTEAGQELVALARSNGVLEFRDVPEGNLERLKKAAQKKKNTGAEYQKLQLPGAGRR